MDLVTQTSLDALLLKATNSNNLNVDNIAVEAFCALINKEKDGAHIGVKVIAARLPSGDEKEVLQTLNVLDTCMKKCGLPFQNEVGKFRFLNEMIKLVSPKYLGSDTPQSVKQKILQLLYVWTLDYPKETKIKEAFDMLRKQGVIKEIPNQSVPSIQGMCASKKKEYTLFQDQEKSKILQKLLQSKDPEDIQAANWLIKSMVKEDDKRTELKSKTITELESVQNNVRLLHEMLDSYKPNISSSDDLELINELYENCQRIKTPSIDKIIKELEGVESHETKENSELSEGMLGDVLEVRDELVTALNKYKKIILKDKNVASKKEDSNQDSLLNFDVVDAKPFTPDIVPEATKSSMDVLCDIFTTSNMSDGGDLLQPIYVPKNGKINMTEEEKDKTSKFKALEDLDVLGELLKKENLQKTVQGKFSKNGTHDKIPMNLLNKVPKSLSSQPSESRPSECLNLDLNCLLKPENSQDNGSDKNIPTQDTSDDFLVDISDEKMLDVEKVPEREKPKPVIQEQSLKNDIKLNDICIQLENIKPSSQPPLTILEEKNGVIVTLHFTKDKPKDGVSVYVLTTVSKNELPLSNYLFQAVVPKGCKLKLQPPSRTDLPTHNPFLPPAAITQIMLLANPENIKITLKFILSYTIDDESITEMGEVNELL